MRKDNSWEGQTRKFEYSAKLGHFAISFLREFKRYINVNRISCTENMF